jgi:enamine deaminase RidA (YjgF/YER057c/UK114 family)
LNIFPFSPGMTNTTAANGKEAVYFGMPWEDAYGYAQAIKVGDTIYVSGQLSHDDKGTMLGAAPSRMPVVIETIAAAYWTPSDRVSTI